MTCALHVQGAAKKLPCSIFASFSTVMPESKVKFGTLVSSSNLHITAKYHSISRKQSLNSLTQASTSVDLGQRATGTDRPGC